MSESLRAVRRSARLLAASLVACLTVAGLLALTAQPTYEARAQFFVSPSAAARDAGDAYRGELFSLQRMASYAQMVSGTELRAAVAGQLGLPGGARALDGRISATVLPDTVLIDVAARDGSARRAQAIAEAVALQLPRLIARLETPPGSAGPLVRASVTRPPDLPAEPVAPDLKVYLALGLLAGLVVGLGGAAAVAATDDRVRDVEAIERILAAPVIGGVTERGDRGGALVTVDEPLSARAEDYRRIRTRLGGFGVPGSDRRLAAFAITGVAGEPTPVATNLAVAFAQGGRRVALIDANPREARPSDRLELGGRADAAAVLAGDVALADAVTWAPELPLLLVDAGDTAGSPRLPALIAALGAHSDVVIVDAPSLPEALGLAASVSATLLVVRLGATRVPQLEAAAPAIGHSPSPVLGLVVARPRRRGVAVAPSFRPGPRADRTPSRLIASGRHV